MDQFGNSLAKKRPNVTSSPAMQDCLNLTNSTSQIAAINQNKDLKQVHTKRPNSSIYDQ